MLINIFSNVVSIECSRGMCHRKRILSLGSVRLVTLCLIRRRVHARTCIAARTLSSPYQVGRLN